MLDYEGDDVEDVFCLSFVMSREVFGSVQTDELKPGGANILVTQKNKYEIHFRAISLMSLTFLTIFLSFSDKNMSICMWILS